MYKCSRRFRRIGLSVYRSFNKDHANVTATKKNVLDDFLSDKRRGRNPTITLYDWDKICNCPKTKSCGIDNLPKVKPLLVNHKQMLIVYYNLKELLQIAKGCAEITSVRKRLLVQGIAGTGKSQVIQIITRAVLNVAPTSAAAVLLPDGRTVHSVTPPPMKKKKNCTMSLVDYPLNAHAMNRMKTLALGADNKFDLMCINADKRGMMGQALTAWFSHRFNVLGASLFPNKCCFNSILGVFHASIQYLGVFHASIQYLGVFHASICSVTYFQLGCQFVLLIYIKYLCHHSIHHAI